MECRNVTREEDVENGPGEDGQIDRDALVSIYRDFPNLVGLEIFVSYGLRGEPACLRNRILGYVNERLSDKSRVVNKKKKEALYARASQTISRPSRVYVRELAMAQAAALSPAGKG
mmetsp:Transcript_852/g.2038  ORF Transcript_852/g.2038 Transcript_852/m.2038 type:complete len:116 (-) Transcript_852:558-905(-)